MREYVPRKADQGQLTIRTCPLQALLVAARPGADTPPIRSQVATTVSAGQCPVRGDGVPREVGGDRYTRDACTAHGDGGHKWKQRSAERPVP